jgi:hypothetical protein
MPDQVGNRLDTIIQVNFIDTSPFEYRDLVINEILADPHPQEELPPFEFVELLNISTRIIELSGWQLSDGSKTVSLDSFLLFPDSILIICPTESKEAYAEFGSILTLASWPSLNNGGDKLKLFDPHGSIVDSVSYESEWYKNSDKNNGGWSLEQINPSSLCLGSFNWVASISIDGGTPGKVNSVYLNEVDHNPPQIIQAFITDTLLEVWFSKHLAPGTYINTLLPSLNSSKTSIQIPTNYYTSKLVAPLNVSNKYQIEIVTLDCSGNKGMHQAPIIPISVANEKDIIINEVLFNPYSTGSDFIEIVNTTESYFNLKNYFLKNESSSYAISDTTLILSPNYYLALSKDILFLKNQYLAPDSSLFTTTLPSMPNDNGFVTLASNTGVIIDSVYYSEDFHFSLISNTEGISLERISLNAHSNNKGNWRSAAEANLFATPGYKNSQSVEPKQVGQVTIYPEIITPNNDGIADFCQVSFELPSYAHTITVSAYNLNGQLVKTIANNYIISPNGFFTWDGTDQYGKLLPTAHYVIFTEIVSSNGQTAHFRNKVVVANGF